MFELIYHLSEIVINPTNPKLNQFSKHYPFPALFGKSLNQSRESAQLSTGNVTHSPAPLGPKGMSGSTLRDVNIARNPAARGNRSPRDTPLSRHSSINAEGTLSPFNWLLPPCSRLLGQFCRPTSVIHPCYQVRVVGLPTDHFGVNSYLSFFLR